MVCDVCNADIVAADGYRLTTSEVVTSESYWMHLLESQQQLMTRLGITDEPADQLPIMIRECVGQTSTWLICEECSEFFYFDRDTARCNSTKDIQPIDGEAPGQEDSHGPRRGLYGRLRTWLKSQKSSSQGVLDQIDRDRCALAAARAWKRVFGQWPSTVNPPDFPNDSCDICEKDLYSAEGVIFFSKESLEKNLALGFFDNDPVRPPRSSPGNMGWLICPPCMMRFAARLHRSNHRGNSDT